MKNDLGSIYVAIMADSAQIRTELAQIKTLLSQQLSLAAHQMGTSATRSFGKASKGANSFHKNLKESLKSALSLERTISRLAFIGTVGAVYALGRAIKNAFKSSIEYAIDFEKQMANVFTMLDKADKKYKDFLSLGVEGLTAKFGEGSETLTKGLYDILSASVPAVQALYTLEISARAAAAGVSSTGVTADAVTGIINAYGLSAGKAGDISDLLFSIVKRGKITFDELAQNIGKVVTSASLGGLSLEELGASISTMTRQSVKPREAMTSLNRLILSFIKPTKQAEEVARKYGFELNAAALKAMGLTGVIKKLEGASKQELAILGTTVRAFKALAAGINDADGQFEDLEEMINRAGKTQDAFNEIQKTAAFKMYQSRQQMRLLGKEIGEFFVPALTQMAMGWRILFKAMMGQDFTEIDRIKSLVEGISFATEQSLKGQLKYYKETTSGNKQLVSDYQIMIDIEEALLENVKRKVALGGLESIKSIKREKQLKDQINNRKEYVEVLQYEIDFAEKAMEVIQAEIAARKKLASADPANQKEQIEEIINLKQQQLNLAKELGDGEREAMESLKASYEEYIKILESVNASAADIVAIQVAIAKLNKEINDFGNVTLKDFKKDFDDAITRVRYLAKEGENTFEKEIPVWTNYINTLRGEFGEFSIQVMEATLAYRKFLESGKTTPETKEEFTNFKDFFLSGINEMEDNWTDYAFTMRDVMDSAIDSIVSATDQMWADILNGENMFKKKWGDYLKDMVHSFIRAVNQMIIKWLAFKALQAAFPGFGLAAGMVSGASYGDSTAVSDVIMGSPNNAPNINVAPVMLFSRRDSAFIVKQGLQEINRTSL